MKTFANLLGNKCENVGGKRTVGVGVVLDHRSYPAGERTGVPRDVPTAFRTLAGTIQDGLPWTAVLRQRVSKEVLFDTFARSVTHLQEMHDEAATMVTELVTAGLQAKPRWVSNPDLYQAVKERTDGMTDVLPSFEFEGPKVLNLDLYQKHFGDILEKLAAELSNYCHRLVRLASEAFDFTVDLEMVGLNEWTAPDTCRFHFFRNELALDDGDAPEPDVADRDDGQSTTLRYVRVVHDLIAARNFTVSAADHIPRPQRLNSLLAVIPRWMRSHLRLVTGKRTTKTLIDGARVTENYAYRKKSALVCGMYVLAHWNETEGGMPALTAPRPRALADKK